MNILVLSQRVPYPPNKGEKIRTCFQLKHLRAQGHRLTVCTLAHDDDDRQSINDLQNALELEVVAVKTGARLPRLAGGLLGGKPLSVSHFYSRRLQKHFDALLKRNRIDAVLCTSSSLAEYVFRSAAARPPRLLMDFMDLDSDKWAQYARTSSAPMRWIYRREARLLARYEQRVQQHFDHCFFISQNEVELFAHRIGKAGNIHVLGNGIDTREFYPPPAPPDNPDPVFIFTGVMDYKPNIDAVLWFVEHVWDGVIRDYPHARFIIAGMNPVHAIEELGRQPGIEVTGFVEDMLPFYHRANYFVAPFTMARGVQNKVLQAFACGLPVISTPVGAEGIACEHGHHLLIADSGEAFLAAIRQLQTSPEDRARIRDNALHLVRKEYSWEGMLRTLDAFLDPAAS